MNFKYKSNIPSEITCVGTQYEDTKELSLGELTLFIESKLMELSNEYYETSIKFAIQLTESEVCKDIYIYIYIYRYTYFNITS